MVVVGNSVFIWKKSLYLVLPCKAIKNETNPSSLQWLFICWSMAFVSLPDFSSPGKTSLVLFSHSSIVRIKSDFHHPEGSSAYPGV